MNRMFKDKSGKKTPTLNPIIGWKNNLKCEHQCIYCYVPEVIKNLQRKKLSKYADCGTIPLLHNPTLSRRIPYSRVPYFVCSLHDLFASSISDYMIDRVIDWCRESDKRNTFLFLTKNPKRYMEYLPKDSRGVYDLNFIFGATIESNLEHHVSSAPLEFERINAMKELKGARKFLSIEPVLDFEQSGFIRDILEIAPEFVYIGYDNHNHGLQEPTEDVLSNFIESLRIKGIEVREKTIVRWRNNLVG